jgi:hypothetical protein
LNCAGTEWTAPPRAVVPPTLEGLQISLATLQSVKNTAHNGSVAPHWRKEDFKAVYYSMMAATNMEV